MGYCQESLDRFTATLLEDVPRFRSTAIECKGIQDLMAEPLGLEPSTLSACINNDPTGALREIVDDVSRRRLSLTEKKLYDLADGEADTGRQQFTALAMLLNNRHPGYGTQKVQHSGEMTYAPPPPAGETSDGPPVLRLLKTGEGSKGDA